MPTWFWLVLALALLAAVVGVSVYGAWRWTRTATVLAAELEGRQTIRSVEFVARPSDGKRRCRPTRTRRDVNFRSLCERLAAIVAGNGIDEVPCRR